MRILRKLELENFYNLIKLHIKILQQMYLMESKVLFVKSGIRLSNTVLVILANTKGKKIVVNKEEDIL